MAEERGDSMKNSPRMVEQAEEVLWGMGFRQCRARHHGDVCRIEVVVYEQEKALEPKTRLHIIRGVKAVGFRHVTLDLVGYGERIDG